MVELPLDRSQIRENIRVIKLKVIEDRRARAVVNKFRAFVEEGAVVFIGLDHEERRAAQTCRHREVLRYATDQEARTHAGMLQHPSQHTAGGGFTVGTGHRQHPAPLQDVIRQPLRAGDIRQALVEHILDCRVTARQRVADHHQVRCRVQLSGVIPLGQLDTLGFKLGAHGWIDIGVGAGDPMPEFFGQHCQRAHESAANTKNMNVHYRPRKTSRQGSPGRRNSHPVFRSKAPGDTVFAKFSIQGIAADA
ncbi:hypothetical protein D3C72_1627600 [compost metagenome]